jgi:hypothetical protein
MNGSIFELSTDVMTLGRADDNDIIIKSESVSRNHASFRLTDDGYMIADNQSKNGIIVNGVQTNDALLRDNDLVQIGDLVFRFCSLVASDIQPPAEISPETPFPIEAPFASSRHQKKSLRPILYGSLGLVFLLVYWMSGGPDPKKKTAPKPAANNQDVPISKSIQPRSDLRPPEQSTVENENNKMKSLEPNTREAEQFFRRGQREYLARNYHRAIDTLQAALAISKSHLEARQYLRWAVRDAESEAEKHRDAGIRYFKTHQFSRAIYHFRQTIALMAHKPTDALVGQSEKYILEASQALEAAEFLP